MASTNLSVFPDQIDTFIQHYEIQAQDVDNLNTYKSLVMTKNRTPDQDSQLTSLTNQLRDKLISADDWNKIQDCVTNLETFFVNNVDGYINQKQSEFEATVNNFRYIGDYSASVTYFKMNVVTYNFETYQCLQDNVINVIPSTDTSKWYKMAAQGEQGIQGLPGLGLVFKGAYSSNDTYNQGDAVQYNGSVYYCTSNNTSGVVPTTTNNWELLNASGSSFKPTFIRHTVVLPSATNSVGVGVSQYNPSVDQLLAFADSTYIEQDQDYTLDTTDLTNVKITTKDGSNWVANTVFNFLVLKNMQTSLIYTDGTMIQDGTISNAKLGADIKVGSLASLDTAAKSDVVSAINEIVNKSVVSPNVAVASGATTTTVTFATAQTDTNYVIGVAVYWNTAWWISNKTTSGFTINYGTAPTANTQVDWSIRR